MTEQEKLEKDIESVLKDRSNCDEYCFTHRRPWACEPCQVKRVTDYCIRKEEEVRKETIKEFISFVKNVIYNYKPTVTETDSGIKTYHYLTDYELFDIINEKYSVEAEE